MKKFGPSRPIAMASFVASHAIHAAGAPPAAGLQAVADAAIRRRQPIGEPGHCDARADRTNDFSKFTRVAELLCRGNDSQSTLEIPALDTWAMLFVLPANQGDR